MDGILDTDTNKLKKLSLGDDQTMTPLQIWRFRTPNRRGLARHLTNAASNVVTQQSHMYKRLYTKDELIKYFVDNVVYKCDNHIVTSIPQGIPFVKTNKWQDYESPVICDYCLQDLLPNLSEAFNFEEIFITKSPKRTSSGLVIFSKNFDSFNHLRKNFELAEKRLKRIYTYLAVVVGNPVENLNKIYKVEAGDDETKPFTEILENCVVDTARARKTKYTHTVIGSTKDVSLVKIRVSYDLRDCVRHILARKCFTPVFGDSWSFERSVKFLFGAPLVNTADVEPQPYKLSSDILEKIRVSEDEQKFIPIHLHFYGVKLSDRVGNKFFVSVPPPESFVWTCHQLGLPGIEEFLENATPKN